MKCTAPRWRKLALAVGLTITGSASAENLSDILNLAFQYDAQLQAAAARRDAATDGIDVSRSQLLPQLSFQASADYSDFERAFSFTDADGNSRTLVEDENRYTNSATVQLSQEVYRQSTWVRLNQSEKRAFQADVNYRLTRQELILRTAQAYFEVLDAQDNLAFIQAQKEAFAKQLEETRQRFAVGLTAITDVEDAQSRFDQSVADEVVAQNRVDNSYESLREITGRYTRDLDILDTESFLAAQPIPAAPRGWVEKAEKSSLRVQSSLLGQNIAEDDIRLARADRVPTIDLFANIESREQSSDGTGRLDSQSIGVQLNVPIYTGNRITSSVRQASNNYSAATQDLEATYRGVVREVRESYNTVVASISSVRAAEQAVRSAESSVEAQQAGYEVGTRTIVELLDATQRLFQEKSRLASSRYVYFTNSLRLKLAAGTISPQDVVEIDQFLIRPTAPEALEQAEEKKKA